ncbi:MAG: beta-galactosidase, partial [Actinomycetota bacterium]|nr:beta-galactosidase [Actinomycetota bacterium]
YFPDRWYCYCAASRREFVAWLKARYDTLANLNDAWSRRFGSWDHVQPPRVFEAVPDIVDWRQFWFDTLSRWLEARVLTVKSNDDITPVMTHVALSGFTGQLATHTLDEFTLTNHVDIFGTSSFPTWLMHDDHVEQLFNLETARDAAPGKPFWQAELQGGRGRRDGDRSTSHPDPDSVELWMWNALAAGASGVMFWQWRPELLGPESPGYGLCTPDGSVTPRVDAASRGASLCRLAEMDGRTLQPPSVALLVSRRSALHAWATDRHMDVYRDAVLGAYRIFADLDVPVMILHEDQLTDGGVPDAVRTVYWPMPSVATDPMSEQLAAFVAAGGRLIAECAPGEYDSLGKRRPVVPGGALAKVFGVSQIETDAADEIAVAIVGGMSLIGGWQRESLRVETATAVGHFADGSPAVTESRFGDGVAILIGTYPSIAYARRVHRDTGGAVANLLAPAAVPPFASWAQPGPGLVSREFVLADGHRAVIAVNWTTKAQPLVAVAALAQWHDGLAWTEPPDGERLLVPARAGRFVILADDL